MVARITTNKIFNGKVYAKNRPNSCVADVVNDLEFDLRLGYHDLNCDVRQDALGRFSTDIIIQVNLQQPRNLSCSDAREVFTVM
jgi:hypothetical protein